MGQAWSRWKKVRARLVAGVCEKQVQNSGKNRSTLCRASGGPVGKALSLLVLGTETRETCGVLWGAHVLEGWIRDSEGWETER